jgi:hypothetical protein
MSVSMIAEMHSPYYQTLLLSTETLLAERVGDDG